MVGVNILGQAIKCLILDSWSITTIIFIQLLLIGRLITKLIKILLGHRDAAAVTGLALAWRQ